MVSDEWLNRRDHGDGVIELQLGRGPVNALSAEFLMEFGAEIRSLGQDRNVKAIVLSSPFKVFSAGLDLKKAQHFDLEQQHAIVRGLNEGFLALYGCPKPTVVAVNGAAIAGGLFFVLASDLRVAVSRASFGLAEVRVGADFPIGPLEIARATLDSNIQRRLMLTGQPIGAVAARNANIIDIITEDVVELMPRAVKEARKLAELPPMTFASVKQQLRGDTIARIEASIAKNATSPSSKGWFNSETKSAMQKMLG